MRKVLNILSSWKVILFFPILFFFVLSQSYALDITLQWDANTELDLDHYVIYWGIDFDPPYGYNSGYIDKSQTTYTVTGLSDDTTYYFAAKAFDTEGLESDYSNVVSTYETNEPVNEEVPSPSGSGSDSGGCFIATTAYGSHMDWHVKILSEFRDRRLVTNPIGRSIVDAYYKFSPPVANYLHKHPFAKAIVRYTLIPITGIAYGSLSIHPLALLFAFALLLLIIIYFTRYFVRLRINIS
jgi:hypothetical protein